MPWLLFWKPGTSGITVPQMHKIDNCLQVSKHLESAYLDLDLSMRPMLGTHTVSKVIPISSLPSFKQASRFKSSWIVLSQNFVPI